MPKRFGPSKWCGSRSWSSDRSCRCRTIIASRSIASYYLAHSNFPYFSQKQSELWFYLLLWSHSQNPPPPISTTMVTTSQNHNLDHGHFPYQSLCRDNVETEDKVDEIYPIKIRRILEYVAVSQTIISPRRVWPHTWVSKKESVET